MTVTPNMVFFVDFALFLVWMQRHHRFTLLIGAMDGTYKIRPTATSSNSGTPLKSVVGGL